MTDIFAFTAKRYCEMLLKEGGVQILESLLQQPNDSTSQPNVSTLCRAILDTLAQQPC